MIVPVLIAIIVGLLMYKMFRKDKINFPGPIPWPVVGNILQITPDRPHQTFDKWHRKFNRDFKMYQLGTPVVVIGSYEVMHEVLVTKGQDFADRPSTYRLGLLGKSQTRQDGFIFCGIDNSWKMLRKAAHQHVKQFDEGMKRIEEVGTEICQDMLSDFASHNGEPFNPREYIMNAIMNNLTVFLLGKKFTTHDKLFRQFFDIHIEGMQLFSPVGPHALIDIFPWFRYLGNKTDGLIQCFLQKRLSLFLQMKKAVLENSSSIPTDGAVPLLQSFLNLSQDPDFVGGETRVRCAASDMMFAGIGTSTSSFLAFVNIITHYRHVYVKLQTEVDDVLGTRSARFNDRDNMPYTKATIFELLRYTSIVPFSVPHMAVKDTKIRDVFIRKGTQVLINLWSSFHDESYWPEPYEFRPERFLDEFGNLLPSGHIVRKRLMPFGAGPRVCIGEVFALGRLFLLITSLIQGFEIEQPEPMVSCDPRSYGLAIVLTPLEFKVKMTPRKVVE